MKRARVYALELAATQLRIATFIAADDGAAKTRPCSRKSHAFSTDASPSSRTTKHSKSHGRTHYMSARKIVLTSGKGGVGKTTTTVNVGAALAKRGHRVILVDADIGLRNLDLVLGLEKRIVFDLVEVVEGRCQLRQALIKDKRFESL